MALISIIIVNWNGRDHIRSCLDSVYRQSATDYEVIFVDNGSDDGSPAMVADHYPSAIRILLDDNRGFTGGNIEGLKHARGKYIVLLNNDAILSEQWLKIMIDTMEGNDAIGFCSSKTLIRGTNRIDSIGDMFTTAFSGTKIGEYEEESSYTVQRTVHGAYAAAAMYRTKMLDQIGFLDDDFFFNHEDTDLNIRAWLAGWRCVFVPEAVAYHAVSASRGTLSDFSVYYYARNIEWVWIKNVPLILMVRFFPQRLVYEAAAFFYFCILKGKYRPFIKGKIDAMTSIRKMIGKRRSVQKNVKLTYRQIRRDLLPISRYLIARFKNIRCEGNARTRSNIQR